MRISQYDRALQELARRSARKLYSRRFSWPSRKAKQQAMKDVKWQCWLTHEESATLDALRSQHGDLSRYGLTRLALLSLAKAAEKETKETPYNGRTDIESVLFPH